MDKDEQQSKIFNHSMELRRSINNMMNTQIIASIVVAIALISGYQSLYANENKKDRLITIVSNVEVYNLDMAWRYDRLLISDQLDSLIEKGNTQKRTRLLFLITVLLVELNYSYLQDSEVVKKSLNEFGKLNVSINRYQQALSTLRYSATRNFSDLDVHELVAYGSYLEFENKAISEPNFDEVWTRVCQTAAFLKYFLPNLKEEVIEKLGPSSRIAQFSQNENVQRLLEWGEKQLYLSEKENAQYNSLVFTKPTDEAIVKLTSTAIGKSKPIETLRSADSSIYLLFDQNSSKEEADRVVKLLAYEKFGSLAEVDREIGRIRNEIRYLRDEKEIPVPFIGTSIALRHLTWFLPAANLIFLMLFLRLVLRESSNRNLIDEANLPLLNQVSMLDPREQGGFQLPWSFAANRNTIGCFGLTLCAVPTMLNTIQAEPVTLPELALSMMVAYVILFVLTYWIWRKFR